MVAVYTQKGGAHPGSTIFRSVGDDGAIGVSDGLECLILWGCRKGADGSFEVSSPI